MLMRGGTSKGAFFRSEDLPADTARRNDLILRIVGSPDPRQIDTGPDGRPEVHRAGIIRTARKLFDGMVFPRPR